MLTHRSISHSILLWDHRLVNPAVASQANVTAPVVYQNLWRLLFRPESVISLDDALPTKQVQHSLFAAD